MFRKAKPAAIKFILGITVGLFFAYMAVNFLKQSPRVQVSNRRPATDTTRLMQVKEEHYPDTGQARLHANLDRLERLLKPMEFHDEHAHNDNDQKAQELSKTVRILCWVMTSPDNLDTTAVHVRNTWAKRCNKLIFISSTTNDSFPTVGLNVSEGRDHLTGKTMQAFRYIYDNHLDDADWFLKTDDDTYVIMENMRYLLKDEDSNSPVYFGHHFAPIVKQGYFSGGAGYILSKEALRRFSAHGRNESECRQDGGAEDAEFGKCMENLGVKVGNSTDRLGRSRFHCFTPLTHLHGVYPSWYYQYDSLGAHKGQESMSDYAITFHYISSDEMYALEFYIYHLRPYGINSGDQDINRKK